MNTEQRDSKKMSQENQHQCSVVPAVSRQQKGTPPPLIQARASAPVHLVCSYHSHALPERQESTPMHSAQYFNSSQLCK